MRYEPHTHPATGTPLAWNAKMVSDSGGAEAAAVRNYLEQRLVREALTLAQFHRPATVAVDVGAGFGRLSCVLAEFAPRVIAAERDPGLRAIGQTLNPGVEFLAVEALDRLPLADGVAELALTFTVLQHLPDDECRRVLTEVQRVVRAGHILLVEETDEAFGPAQFRPESGTHLGRSASRYAEWMAPWQLVRSWPRQVEPTYPRRDVGTAMLFERLPGATTAASDKLELGCGKAPTPGYLHHDRARHSAHVDVAHDLDVLPWPWADGAFTEILGLDVFEHLHLMPEAWLRECHRLLVAGGVLRLRVPIFGSAWHLIDPTHVRGFHPLNFDYFIRGRELYQKFGHFYFDFAFADGTVSIDGHNIVGALRE
jgi:SAM-dependent methyltransferase